MGTHGRLVSVRAFVGVDEEIFEETDDGWVVEQIASHLEGLLGDQWHNTTLIELVPGVPDCARILLYCWSFQVEAAGNGLYDYLINQEISDEQLVKTAWALREVGHEELASRLESAVLCAFKEDSRFVETHARSNFSHFVLDERFPTVRSAGKGSIELAGEGLEKTMAEFARKNHAMLVSGFGSSMGS